MPEKNSHSKRIQSDVIKSAPRFSCIVIFIPLRFYLNLKFPDRFSKNSKISNFIKIPLMGAELIHAGERSVG
jgi:hypothetical protein